MLKFKLTFVLLIILLPGTLLAYVGPGAGISLIGAIGAVLAAIFFAIAGIVLWPIRAMRKKKKLKEAQEQEQAQTSDSAK